MPESTPSTHGPNGRGPGGRFAPGNKCGRGNPLAGEAAKIRALLFKRASKADREAIIDVLIEKAKSGDMQAVREYLDRTAGKAVASDIIERLDELERIVRDRLATDTNHL